MASKEIIQSLVDERQKYVDAIAGIEHAINALSGEYVITILDRHVGQDFKGLGMTEAARRLLGEVNEPRTTREILNAIKKRGVVSRSKKESATLYATLTNSKAFKRTADGKWALVEWASP